MKYLKWIGAALLLALTGPVQGADYPEKPIRLIVPFNPGGSYDTVARVVADSVSKSLNQQIIVEDRPGTGSLIGTEQAYREPADGYTVVMFGSNHSILPTVHTQASFKLQSDFIPVSLIGKTPYVLVVNPGVAANSVSEFIALAKKEPGRMNYGSGGKGSISHLGMAMFNSKAGIDLTHIPYKAGIPAMMDLIAGEIQAGVVNVSFAIPQAEAGKLKILGIATSERYPKLANVPTLIESGVDLELAEWYGFAVKRDTPREIVDRLNSEFSKAVADPNVRQRLEPQGMILFSTSPEEFSEFLDREIKMYGEAAKEAGIVSR